MRNMTVKLSRMPRLSLNFLNYGLNCKKLERNSEKLKPRQRLLRRRLPIRTVAG